ncbi:MAG TPA: L-threonylcarbamoyladenylate synthase [Candidatus Norongarragalinales archaeon]|nr:L-threonylcarbamoyladenylate synthase [Candidatus Norongarragalinales archaeon]
MQTKVIKLEHDMEKMAKLIDQCVAIVKKGGLVAYPTETSYGIGCDATNKDAVKKIYEVKGRDPFRPLPVIVSDLRMAEEHCTLDDRAKKLVNAFMPGPLTLVVQKKHSLPDELTTKGVAFRIPGKDFPRLFAQECGVPLVSTSANISGKTPIYRVDELKQTFDGKIDLIVDAGNLPPVRPSTIIDLRGRDPIVVREGPLSVQDVITELAD